MYVKYRGQRGLEIDRRILFAGAAVLLAIMGLMLASRLVQPRLSGLSADLSVAEGTVSVYRAERTLLDAERTRQVDVRPGKVFAVGVNHSLVAGESSRARLGFPDGSYVELEPSTALRITALDETEAGYDLRVNLTAGRITSYVRPRLAGAYEVITPSATISATGTVFSVEVVADQAAIVSCAEGEVVVWTGREQLVLAAGETIAAIAGQP